ncbi:MAG: hypothetical protein LBD62_05455 [Candidatus Margulisbacteria bacterium]|jgi:hypothetical protein|nr:hypothetical protein [Candidatus Margulisiibacteriota bacterium]
MLFKVSDKQALDIDDILISIGVSEKEEIAAKLAALDNLIASDETNIIAGYVSARLIYFYALDLYCRQDQKAWDYLYCLENVGKIIDSPSAKKGQDLQMYVRFIVKRIDNLSKISQELLSFYARIALNELPTALLSSIWGYEATPGWLRDVATKIIKKRPESESPDLPPPNSRKFRRMYKPYEYNGLVLF